jgi:hypothetical protein
VPAIIATIPNTISFNVFIVLSFLIHLFSDILPHTLFLSCRTEHRIFTKITFSIEKSKRTSGFQAEKIEQALFSSLGLHYLCKMIFCRSGEN